VDCGKFERGLSGGRRAAQVSGGSGLRRQSGCVLISIKARFVANQD
jgi:hypothetical protein